MEDALKLAVCEGVAVFERPEDTDCVGESDDDCVAEAVLTCDRDRIEVKEAETDWD